MYGSIITKPIMDLYAENILDHYKHPHHKGVLQDATAIHTEVNPSCGDSLTLHLAIMDGNITHVAWTGTGCVISQAGMSILSDELIGKSAAEAEVIDAASIKKLLGVAVGTRRLKCALLCLHTLKNALRSHRGVGSQPWHETVGNEAKTR